MVLARMADTGGHLVKDDCVPAVFLWMELTERRWRRFPDWDAWEANLRRELAFGLLAEPTQLRGVSEVFLNLGCLIFG
jgi:hypothetical protein